jgi:uncharacterized membrane protein YhhN
MAALKYRPYPFSNVVKIIPILSLALIAIMEIPGRKGKIVFAGLVFSATGDFLLALQGKGYFVYGLSSFGIAHIMYIAAFFEKPASDKRRIALAAVFIIYGITVWNVLAPNLGNMLLPVSIYILLITGMGISTTMGENNNLLVIAGAILFVCSDSFIAINVFLSKIPNSSFWIMLTYFPAQFFITLGTERGEKKLKLGKAENS